MKKKGLICLVTAVVVYVVFFAGSSLAGEKRQLTVWIMEPLTAYQDYYVELINEFQKANPEADISYQFLGWGPFLAKVVAAKAAGNPPDVIYTISSHMWNFKENGWLRPVDDVIEQIGEDQFFQKHPGYTNVDGHYWGVPMTACTMHLEYRKDLFDKKGLKPPRTWDDLLTAAQALTEDVDGDGKIDRYGIAMPLKRDYALGVHFLGYLWGNGGHVLDKQGNVVFNSSETVETLNFLKELYKYAPPGVSGYSWYELSSTYVMDKVAITTNSALQPLSDAIKANESIANNTAVAAIPTRLASQKPKGRFINMEWLVFKECKDPDLAKEFLTFRFAPKQLIKFYHVLPIMLIPAEIPVTESNEYWKNDVVMKYQDALKMMIELNRTAAVDPAMEHPGILQPNTTVINQRLLIAECVQDVVLGNIPAEKAAAKAHKRMEKLVAKGKK